MSPCSEAEIGWLAGIIEGEGCVCIRNKKNKDQKVSTSVDVKVKMTDRDVIYKLKKVSGIGNIGKKAHVPKNPKWNKSWTWTVYAIKDCIDLLKAIRPLMGKRRGGKIDDALKLLSTKKSRKSSSIKR